MDADLPLACKALMDTEFKLHLFLVAPSAPYKITKYNNYGKSTAFEGQGNLFILLLMRPFPGTST